MKWLHRLQCVRGLRKRRRHERRRRQWRRAGTKCRSLLHWIGLGEDEVDSCTSYVLLHIRVATSVLGHMRVPPFTELDKVGPPIACSQLVRSPAFICRRVTMTPFSQCKQRLRCLVNNACQRSQVLPRCDGSLPPDASSRNGAIYCMHLLIEY
jgi:hypothetical protein